MIRTEDLTKKFDEFVAVEGVHLDIPQGQVLVLLGPNGAGKTTTVRMLSSALRPTRGWATVAGYDVVKDSQQVRSLVGVLTELHGLYKRMNAKEYLTFFAQLYRMEPEHTRLRIEMLLEEFGLGDVGKKRLGEYSKGMRQKLALVRALLHDPPVLLLDEPTSAMDPESAKTVRDSIRNLKSGNRTLILCTHNLSEAEELADQLAIIQSGQIILSGTAEHIKSQLLGPAHYEIQFSGSPNGREITLPAGTTLIQRDETHLRYQTNQPDMDNPLILRGLLNNNFDVVALQKVPQSLEDAYLKAVQSNMEAGDA